MAPSATSDRVLEAVYAARPRLEARARKRGAGLGDMDIECAVDQALDAVISSAERYESPEHAVRTAYLALDQRLLDRRRAAARHPLVAIDAERFEGCWEVADTRSTPQTEELLDAAGRATELLGRLDPDTRALARVLYRLDAEGERASLAAAQRALGWTRKRARVAQTKLEAHAREVIQQRESGQLCREAETLLAELQVLLAIPGHEDAMQDPRFEPLWLHIGGCQACRLQARRARVLRDQLAIALLPIPFWKVIWAAIVAWVHRLAMLFTGHRGQGEAAVVGGGGGGVATLGLGAKAAVCGGLACLAGGAVIGAGGVGLLSTHSVRPSARRPSAPPPPAGPRLSYVPVAPTAAPVVRSAASGGGAITTRVSSTTQPLTTAPNGWRQEAGPPQAWPTSAANTTTTTTSSSPQWATESTSVASWPAGHDAGPASQASLSSAQPEPATGGWPAERK